MRSLRIYLDTSIVNFLFAEDAPEKMAATPQFWGKLDGGHGMLPFVSSIVEREIGRTRAEVKRHRLRAALEGLPVTVVDAAALEPELTNLAASYLEAGVLPEDSMEDALHVAIATILELDVLASWNYKHLANYRRELRFAGVNATLGYSKTPRLMTPLELSDESF